jgi:hypothetical protein
MPEELDLLMECEEIHVAEENSGMEWNDTVFETCEVYMGHNNCEEVARKVFDMTELEMEWTTIELETGEMYVGHNNCGDMGGKVYDVIYEMQWEDIELETDEVYERQKYYEE